MIGQPAGQSIDRWLIGWLGWLVTNVINTRTIINKVASLIGKRNLKSVSMGGVLVHLLARYLRTKTKNPSSTH